MYKQKIVLFLILFFTCMVPVKLFSQIAASQTIGCAPLQVYFTAPPGATSANWNLGNGSSTQLNPATIYNTPGVYNVTYNGTGGSPTNAAITITVVANNVTANISSTIPSIHCAPMPVNFVGTSTGGGNLYQWAFGDGGGGLGANIIHPYTIGGIFNATLVVTNTLTGCAATATNGPINVSFVPNVIISANPGINSCIAPFTTAFTGTNSSSGSPFTPTLTYSWNFGNSQTSTQATPGNITYVNQGYYNVSLSVTDDNNCSNSTTVVVSVVQPTVNANVPANLCINGQQSIPSLQIFSLSAQSSQPYTIWQMGDGYTMMVPPPFFSLTPTAVFTHTYPLYVTPGLKTLTITASIGNCVATQTKTIFVEQIVPSFTSVPPTYTCSPQLITGYLNQTTVNSNSSLSYNWTVSHWNNVPANAYSSTATNPTFTLEQGSLNPYTYYGLYRPQARLLVMSSLGCRTVTVRQYDSIRRPTAWFNKDKKQGCAPLTVRFRDSSDTHATLYPITSYTWNNGASPPTIITGNVPPAVFNPTFTYSSPGTYTPFLIINTAGGCTDISFIDTVIVVGTPTVAATFTPNLEVCAGQPFQINMSALPSSSVIQHWHAQSDDQYFSGCVSNPNPIWFMTHLGTHNFTVSAYDHSCESTTPIVQTVKVTGPIVKSRFRTNCINKKSVDFFSHLQEADAAILNFGDGTPSYTITGNPTGTVSSFVTHTYAATGDYTATVTASNSAGSCAPYTYTMLVMVREIKADFSMVPVMCKGGFMSFTATPSVDVFTSCFRGYTWFVDTLEPRQLSGPIYNDIFDAPGTHTITLWVKDINGCGDEMTKTFIIDSPTPSFSVAANPACASSMPLQFVNTTPQSPVVTALFTWNFNNGPPPSYNSIYTTTNVADWPLHTFTASVPYQTYSVTLTAVSLLLGCIETYTMILQVNNPPDAYLYADAPKTCVNQPVTFNAPSGFTNVVNYDDNSALVTSTANVFVHTYTAAGFYEPVLSFADAAGCISSYTSAVDVQDYPIANFTIYPTFQQSTTPVGSTVFCTPFISFKSTSVSSYSLDYYWDLNTGSPIVNDSVVLSYFTPGVHTVTLIAITKNGCSNVIGKTFAILQPTATPVIDKASLCFGEPLKVSMKDTNDVMAWKWYFEGGFYTDTIMGSSAPSPTLLFPYQYYPAPFGSGVINLIVYSAGYACANTSTLGIKVTVVDADFKRNSELASPDSVHCLDIEDLFTNTSKINNSTFINGLYFNWNFGNGVTSTSMNPTYTYPLPGVYTVTLSVSDPQAGCVDVSVKNMTIHPLPTVAISVPDSVCSGSSFVLMSNASTDVSQYQWLPTLGVANPNAATTPVTTTVSTTFSLMVSSVNGCTATSNTEYVYIQQPIPVIQWDTTIVIGQPAVMSINVGPTYSYTWSPLTDLSCEHCPYPTTTSTNNITYTVEVEDQMGCFRTINTFSVVVDPITSIDVPTAFTPNGDGVNDVIYVDGWGIRKLNYFRIFNRWGQLLFESTDIKIGWNGIYNGVPQNMETYVYQVSADGYIEGSHMEKTSSFRLIR